jgi:hypothetical protein
MDQMNDAPHGVISHRHLCLHVDSPSSFSSIWLRRRQQDLLPYRKSAGCACIPCGQSALSQTALKSYSWRFPRPFRLRSCSLIMWSMWFITYGSIQHLLYCDAWLGDKKCLYANWSIAYMYYRNTCALLHKKKSVMSSHPHDSKHQKKWVLMELFTD